MPVAQRPRRQVRDRERPERRFYPRRGDLSVGSEALGAAPVPRREIVPEAFGDRPRSSATDVVAARHLARLVREIAARRFLGLSKGKGRQAIRVHGVVSRAEGLIVPRPCVIPESCDPSPAIRAPAVAEGAARPDDGPVRFAPRGQARSCRATIGFPVPHPSRHSSPRAVRHTVRLTCERTRTAVKHELHLIVRENRIRSGRKQTQNPMLASLSRRKQGFDSPWAHHHSSVLFLPLLCISSAVGVFSPIASRWAFRHVLNTIRVFLQQWAPRRSSTETDPLLFRGKPFAIEIGQNVDV